MHKKILVLLTALIGLLGGLGVQAQYAFDAVPNPKSQGHAHYVSDPDRHLSGNTLAQLDALGAKIEAANGSEFAIVIVDDYQGDDDFHFALNLFNHWGIGKQGSNNGLLLFLAMDRREYRFTTGSGLEGIFPDILLKRIGEDYLVPYLQIGDTNGAVLAAAKAVESVFLSPDHSLELDGLQAYRPTFWNLHAAALERTAAVLALYALAYGWISFARTRVLKRAGLKTARDTAWSFWFALLAFLFVLFISLFPVLFLEIGSRVYQFGNLPYFAALFGMLLLSFHYYRCAEFVQKDTKDKKTSLDRLVALTRLCLPALLLSPLAYKAVHDLKKHRRHAQLRETPPDGAGPWTRLDRDTLKRGSLKTYLSALQQREEKLDAQSYEIWQNTDTGDIRLKAFPGTHAEDYTTCPSCQGHTLKEPAVKVRKPATYSRSGTGERVQACAFCNYANSLGMVTLPKLERDSGSGSGGSGGGSGGGSSGSSFGGGSSSGGGAGGRW
ncbi:TPM domain-containing protein [Castellaniella hirudinis]|uniref:TPM domain-containing protein n=1 Tax=Castellaniella hirudinis TaxID=1144617 RepID=A0ABV8S1F4_9BURK